MAYSVANQHTDGYRNHDGSYKLHGIKKVGTDRNLLVPYSIYVTTARLCNTVPDPCDQDGVRLSIFPPDVHHGVAVAYESHVKPIPISNYL